MTDIEFGKRFSGLLESKNITNTKLTELAGLSKNNIGNYKNGQIPNASILYKLSQLLGVSMEYLLAGKEATELTQTEQKLIDLYRNTNEIGQPLIVKHAEDIQKALPRAAEASPESSTSLIG